MIVPRHSSRREEPAFSLLRKVETPALVRCFRCLWPVSRASASDSSSQENTNVSLRCGRTTPGHVALATLLALTLAACGTTPKKPEPAKTTTTKPGAYYLDDGPGDNPPNLDSIVDATPRIEPLHRGANRPYTVFGKTYTPNVANEPFRQQGIASWYGRKFHGQMTSIGNTYDMYAMTAAHPTLPLPSYVRVTNPANM